METLWKKDDRVLCRHLNSEVYYQAKIQSVETNEFGPVYSIHYQVLSFLNLVAKYVHEMSGWVSQCRGVCFEFEKNCECYPYSLFRLHGIMAQL